MSGDATSDWLAALRAALVGDSQLATLVGTDGGGNVKVYARPPAEVPLPFVTIGDASWGDWSTSDTAGQEIRHDVECWDQQQISGNESPSAARVRQIADRVRAICHREDLGYVPFAVSGRNLVLVQAIAGRLQLEQDGMTNRAVVTLRVLIGN